MVQLSHLYYPRRIKLSLITISHSSDDKGLLNVSEFSVLPRMTQSFPACRHTSHWYQPRHIRARETERKTVIRVPTGRRNENRENRESQQKLTCPMEKNTLIILRTTTPGPSDIVDEA